MEKINIFIIVYFITFAVIDFIIYAILAKYLYMSGGATREDVKLYLSEQGANGQRRLVEWLRHRTPQPAMLETMFRVCSVLTGIAFFSSVLIMVLNIYQNTTAIIVCAVAVAVISIAATLYGFLYSKKVKETFASYFDSSRYRPYTGEILSEYIESEAELYDVTERPTVSFTQAEKEKVDKQVKYGQQIAIFIVVVIILSIPIISLNQSRTNNKNDEQTQSVQPITGISNVQDVLEPLGISTYNAYEDAQRLSSDFKYFYCIAEKGEGHYFGYYELDSAESATELQKIIKVKIINDYNAESFDGQEEINEKFTMYSYESEDIYAVSICCNKSVIYAYSDQFDKVWLKSLLNDLGYLKEF